ncbi:MAG TPA: hypothetical protein VE172_16105 [Stackebrandtia sp.]|jgi:hypothetical protein|nr:hypothetical protein [Stackebrandtia sp.]HZE40327.1 hypothetical protein [Stackebrandtia sp.]
MSTNLAPVPSDDATTVLQPVGVSPEHLGASPRPRGYHGRHRRSHKS